MAGKDNGRSCIHNTEARTYFVSVQLQVPVAGLVVCVSHTFQEVEKYSEQGRNFESVFIELLCFSIYFLNIH